MDAFEALHTRRSIRQFLNRPVGEDIVKELLSAAMSAPTAGASSRGGSWSSRIAKNWIKSRSSIHTRA